MCTTSSIFVSFNRISYSVHEFKRVRHLNEGTRSKVIMMYDIACPLANHLRVSQAFDDGCGEQ